MIQVRLEPCRQGYRLWCSGHAAEGSPRENTAVCAAASMLYSLVRGIASAHGGCLDTSEDRFSAVEFASENALEAARIGLTLLQENYPNQIVLQKLPLPPGTGGSSYR